MLKNKNLENGLNQINIAIKIYGENAQIVVRISICFQNIKPLMVAFIT